MDGVDDIAFLAGSEPRVAVLSALFEEGKLEKDELVERVDAARVTVSRNLDRLSDRGLVTASGRVWRLTPLGAFLAEDFLTAVETAGIAGHLTPVLRRLPPAAFDLDPEALSDARVTVASAAHPYAPVDRHGETVMAADRVRMLLPAVSPRLMDESAELLRDGALEMELVVSASVAATFRSDLTDRLTDLRSTGNFEVYEVGGAVPFYLGLVDGDVQIGVSDDDGIPRAIAESDADRVRSWAEATYESYRTAAEPWNPDEPVE
ncbi:MAG: hypothetical protein V5A23_07780 [Halobacteriales archaeon]